MSIKFISPKKSVNSAFLKLPVPVEKMEDFKLSLKNLYSKRNTAQDEEYHKGEIWNFLRKIFEPDYSVQVNRPIDLCVFNGNTASAKPAVIIEAKSPTNAAEMFSAEHSNVKSLQELVYYFMLEYVHSGNHEIKWLAITNFDEWYFFDVKDFIRYFGNKSKPIYDQFLKFKANQMSGNKTSDFYNDIAKPAIDDFLASCDINVVHFNLEDACKNVIARSASDEAIHSTSHISHSTPLLPLYKFLSPETLLAKPFANDSNSLDRNFYAELLHIIGLEEVKEDKGGKKVIQRKKPANRDKASLLESAIYQLEDDFPNKEECEAMALRLCITWVNRLLFLKLVESQILMYQKGDVSYRFMSTDKIANFDELNIFFFKVLGKKIEDRDEDVLKRYPNVPYLNSSLFEPTEDEKHLKIRGIPDAQMEIFNKTVLKDERGKRAKGTLPNLDYIFKFLDAYNFASDAQGGVTSTSKTLINASVLGLIFEKINGYKDGSFFTPGFITDYMARDVLERTVVQKFNEKKSWKCENLEDVSDKIEDISEANQIVDDIRVADVAVGSGHFLVSALNRLLAIKSELNILCDAEGKRIKRRDLILKVDNDELSVVDDEGEPFEYKPGNEESQRYQEALFNEKRRIIENCLFGVDLNPNSVNICRLRLWIELLKNAYYTKESGHKQLQTLPNIDINIKVGDSLLSKYPVQNGRLIADYLTRDERADRKRDSLKNSLIEYRQLVQEYKTGKSQSSKMMLRQKIAGIKSRMVEDVQIEMFEEYKGSAGDTIDFSNSLEWMFEFPEILDDEGRFTGFDAIIGNPPYGLFNKKQNQNVALTQDEKVTQLIRERFPEIDEGMINAAKVFYALAFRLTKKTGLIEMIVPFGILSETSSVKIRKKILTQHSFLKVSIFPERDSVRRRVFEDAKMSTAILLCSKAKIDCPILIGSSYKREIPSEYSSFSVEDIGSYSPNAWQMPMCNRATFDLMMKLRNQEHYQKFSDVTTCMTGELDMTLGKKYLSEDSTETMLVKGVQVAPYVLKTKDEDISQGKVEYVRTEDFFVKCSEEKQKEIRHERIAMQGLSGINEKIRLKATLVPANYILANSANFFKYQEKYSLYFLLAVFNSKLLNFIFKATSTSSNVNGYEVNALPFPRINAEKETLVSEIENISKRILELKSENHDVDIAALENETDKLVYKLYDLTEEEIGVVESV
jgi:Alw26I/Eco31I/Esp3I family type II restriction m6 adenine DNA methyltransferase